MKTFMTISFFLFLSTGCTTNIVHEASEDNVYNRRPEVKASTFKKTAQAGEAFEVDDKNFPKDLPPSRRSALRAAEVNGQAHVSIDLPFGDQRVMTRLEEDELLRQRFHQKGFETNSINSIDKKDFKNHSAAQIHDVFKGL